MRIWDHKHPAFDARYATAEERATALRQEIVNMRQHIQWMQRMINQIEDRPPITISDTLFREAVLHLQNLPATQKRIGPVGLVDALRSCGKYTGSNSVATALAHQIAEARPDLAHLFGAQRKWEKTNDPESARPVEDDDPANPYGV